MQVDFTPAPPQVHSWAFVKPGRAIPEAPDFTPHQIFVLPRRMLCATQHAKLELPRAYCILDEKH